MKIIVGSLVLTTLLACSSLKYSNAKKIQEYSSCTFVVNKDKKLLIDVVLENVKTKFMFDTGLVSSFIIDTTIIADFHCKKMSRLVSIQNAKGTNKKYFAAKLKSELFKSKRKVLTYTNFPKASCGFSKHDYTGILGLDAFSMRQFLMQIDFTNHKVCNLSKVQFKVLTKENNYFQIKSSCMNNQIFVFLSIDGCELPFKVNTGYSGGIVMPCQKNFVFSKRPKAEYISSVFSANSSFTTKSEYFFEGIPINFGSIVLDSKINLSPSIKSQNIGIDFIKAFDWLIDYKNNKVYVRRNQNKIESTFSRMGPYFVKVHAEKLVVAIKEKSQTLYHLGDEIIAVNGHKVLPENICQLMNLLNKTDDWSKLSLDVFSAQQ